MKRILTALLASVLSASFMAAELLPATAAPVYLPQAQSVPSQVQDIDYKPWLRRGVHRRDGAVYYNGHRGYREYRRGYRRHGDFWFPLAAFAAGAIISGAIANDRPPAYASGNAHVSWCYDRYRSYRAYDNTFQPYNGPRRQCYSPYR
ncbi:lectin-like protein BA14k [Mesorhizobium sp. Root157]|uniref:BA14K family protein n=1 Tax=Mesorhizobium sp. Root157 TaxID=1736477 RepID=UPI000700D41B|nr:BA14K family protein [Mesorhizobium sp. Root157]KQZ98519.1 lectin-like protein BA14k [Mesorhizobium sp. Root157]